MYYISNYYGSGKGFWYPSYYSLLCSPVKPRAECCVRLDASQGSNLRRGPYPAVPCHKSQNYSREPLRMLRVRPSDLQLVVLIVFGPLGAYTGRTNMQVPLLLHRAGIAGSGLGRIADLE